MEKYENAKQNDKNKVKITVSSLSIELEFKKITISKL